MWCYLSIEHEEQYLRKYPKFQEYWSELIILKTEKTYFLPRLFYYNYPATELVQYFGKVKVPMGHIDLKFSGKLRPAQKEAAKVVEDLFFKQQYVNAILKLPPGSGKTVLAVYLAIKLKLKTCIVIDNSELLKQWIVAIMSFGNLTENDIGLIRGKIYNVDKPFTIAMTQSLGSQLKRNFNPFMKKIDKAQFGLVIYDEVHCTSSSEMFAKVSVFFRTRNVLGLSATPFHNGCAEVLMKNTIGNIEYESKEYEMTPNYNLVFYNSGLQKYTFVMNKMTDYIQKKSYYNKILVQSEAYLDLIARLSQKMRTEGHNIIIICMTKKQVNLISDRLTDAGLENRKFTGTDREIDKENDTLLVCTYQMVGKGFDMSRLSGLILASLFSGKKSLIQICGRVLRSEPGKLKPAIYDLIDGAFPMFTIPEIRRKKKIITEEFPGCKIREFDITKSQDQIGN